MLEVGEPLQVPAPVAEELHRGRQQDRPDNGGVDQHGRGEADTQLREWGRTKEAKQHG